MYCDIAEVDLDSYPLACVSASPRVRAQLRISLSADELAYLVQTHRAGNGIVIQKQALTTQFVALLRKSLASQMQLSQRSKLREETEEERFRYLLGTNCPPLQRRLFDCLCDGRLFWIQAPYRRRVIHGHLNLWVEKFQALAEREVVEIVYQVEWPKFDDLKRARYRARLRKLQQALDDRLTKNGTPFRVIRPRMGWLFLWEQQDPKLPQTTRRTPKKVRATKNQQKLDDFVELVHAIGVHEAFASSKKRQFPTSQVLQPADLPACRALVKAHLANGPRAVSFLKDIWKKRSGLPGTLRRAFRQLGVKHFRKGGSSGKWFVDLPMSECVDR